jgi:outer membrane protein assembly factor BamB
VGELFEVLEMLYREKAWCTSGILIIAAMLFSSFGTVLAEYFELSVNVIGDGRIDPNVGTFPADSVVTIQAWPNEGNWVHWWTGSDDDWSTELTNTVTMDSNKEVTVEFEPAIIVQRPAEADVWAAESSHQIRWSSYGAGAVDILLSGNGGFSWQAIAGGVADTGSYDWQFPMTTSDECMILVVPSAFDSNVLSIPSGIFEITSYSQGQSVTSKWPTLGGQAQREGLSSDSGPEFGCVQWEFEVDGAISASITVGPEREVYVPCEDGNLYTLDSNGSVLWSYDAGTPLISSATLGPDGTAYVGGKDGKLYSIDSDGNLRWTFTTDGFMYSSPVVSDDGKVYFGSEDGKIYALDADGSELWSYQTQGGEIYDGAVLSSPTIGFDGSVYVGGMYDANLYCLDGNNGNVNWVCHFDSGGWPFASPVVGSDGAIYQTLLYDPNLYAISPADGNIVWATNLSDISSGWFEPTYYESFVFNLSICDYIVIHQSAIYNASELGLSEPVIGPDGTIYVSFDDPNLRAVNPDGTIRWIYPIGENQGYSLTVGYDGFIYAASNDSNLYVVHPAGFEWARFDSNESWLNYPVISKDNTVIVSDSRNNSLLISYENNKVVGIGSENCPEQERVMYYQGGSQDINGDGIVDGKDLNLLVENWLKCSDCRTPDAYLSCRDYNPTRMYFTGDLNRDRYVDFFDYAIFAMMWMQGY